MLAEIQTIEIMQDVLSSFRDWLEENGKNEKTVSAYIQDVAIYIRWFEWVNNITFSPEMMISTDVRHFREHSLEVEKVSPATWNRRHASIGQFCQFLADTYDLVLFSMKKIKRAAVEESAPRALSPADKRMVLRELELQVRGANTHNRRNRALRDQAMTGLMMFAGLRVSEVVKLCLSDLQLGERTGKVFIRESKHNKSGWVQLSSTAREFLQEWLEVRPQGSHMGQPEHDLVFVDDRGKGITTRAVQKRIQQMETRLGIDGLEPHALRHTAATEMLEAGVPLNKIQKVMRHKRLETTFRYLEPTDQDLADAVEAGELGKYGR
jgi:integrase/recombinase XerC